MSNGKFSNKELIRWIIDTYDLPSSLKQRIILIAERRIEELSLGSFDKQYRYISGFIDKFIVPYSEKFALSLDAPLMDGSNTTLQEILEGENKEINLSKGFLTKKILECLEGKLDVEHIGVIRKLIEKCDEDFLNDIFSEGVLLNTDEVKWRIEELVQRYGKDGHIVLPTHPIYTTRLLPIRFGVRNRKYNGNPLFFFKRNQGVYGWIKKRGELSIFDYALYKALKRHGQLAEAIPKSYRGFPSPLQFLKSNPKYSNLTKGQLRKTDRALYVALFRAGQLHFLSETIRSKIYQKKEYREFPNPLEYFKAHSELHNLTRSQLAETDEGLYNALRKRNQLQKAIPKDYRFSINSH